MPASNRWIVALTAVLTAVFVSSAWWEGGLGETSAALALALLAANTLPLLGVRRNPLAVVLVFSVAYPAWVAFELPAHELQSLPTLAAMYALGNWDRPLRLRAIGLGVPVWMVGAAIYGLWDVDPLGLSYVGLMFVVVWGLGVVVAGRRAYALALEARTAELERARRELAERAVADERARIARELHDVIAHAMSVITVQAGVGNHLVAERPAQAAEALRIIERTGREAVAEMRRLLTVLRDPDPRGPLPEPQPGLADLPRLVEQAGDAGATFSYTIRGTVRSLSPGLELAVYRVVQEAITNAVKHAPGSRGSVVVSHLPEGLCVEVSNSRSPGGTMEAVSPGHGMQGMAERVALYDGVLETVADETSFRVVARFPQEGAA